MRKGDQWADNLYRIVGQNIARSRKSRSPKSVTQHELARRTSNAVSRSSVANIERGLQHVSLAQLYLVANALGVEIGTLLPSRDEVLGVPADPAELKGLRRPLSESEQAFLTKAGITRVASEGD